MSQDWERFKNYYYWSETLGFGLDVSLVNFPDQLLKTSEQINLALDAMEKLDDGAISNADEERMVGHYWLRSPELSPSEEIKSEITITLDKVKNFSKSIHAGEIKSKSGSKFKHLLIIGIGGSALGPQLFADALFANDQKMDLYFFDNTDPDGFLRTLSKIPDISATLVLTVSKSGGTRETKNGLAIAEEYWRSKGLEPGNAFVAITQEGSELYKHAQSNNWLDTFPMWDWVGGRTSVWSAVGLLPAALMGVGVDELLKGAAQMDELNRTREVTNNPAAMLALTIFHLGNGVGDKNMVVLPYKDRLALFSKYLQQLIMESLGKELDRNGTVVNQGLSVFGNKGSTDQHSYVQQLRDGLDNFFAVFIEVLKDVTAFDAVDTKLHTDISGDYLAGFFQGTQQALYENGRQSITITVKELNTCTLGALIALFERFVGVYAELINVNAYHQPGVEAGKRAAEKVVEAQGNLLRALEKSDEPKDFDSLVSSLETDVDQVTVFRILARLVANERVLASEENLLTAGFSLP